LANHGWATQARNTPRALEAQELARLCKRLGANVEAEPQLSTALERAMRNARGIVTVTGSLMLVGQARATLGVPAPEQLW
jgi:folylpolyglutamate synthase/dihydropteroate synthase